MFRRLPVFIAGVIYGWLIFDNLIVLLNKQQLITFILSQVVIVAAFTYIGYKLGKIK